ncbi:hypothetical protein Q9189_006700 [Teloschistes chrysophthalmus]
MESIELHQALDTSALSLAYEKCLRQNDLVHGVESLRKLNVQVLLLEDENDDLREQINRDEEQIQRMEHGQNAMRNEMKKLEASLESARGDARVKGREIETLKAELQSLHSVTMDSTKLLTEKLALSRELSTLRPEIDHFRSQVASNQTLLAEKLLLEHQLSTVQMELESEKKSIQQFLAKDGKVRAEDAKIESQLQIVRAELQRERRDRQTLERESREASSTWDAQKMTLESRLETFRSKLRTTKDSLKDAQRELQDARSTAKSNAHERADVQDSRGTVVITKKRNAAQMLSDSMIGTPGDMVDDRRTKRASTLPGDKSTFSITPYLNRVASAAPESPQEDGPQTCDVPKTNRATVLAQEKGKKGSDMAKVARSREKSKTGAVLEQVAEEEDGEDDIVEQNLPRQKETTDGDDMTLAGNECGKRKKRRMFGGGPGKTLFDEDEPELIAPAVKARAFGSLKQTNNGFVEIFQARSNCRHASSSSKRWQTRQGRDKYAINAKVQGLKSRAAYKLLEHLTRKINEKYRIFRPGQTVVDLVRKLIIMETFPSLRSIRDTRQDLGLSTVREEVKRLLHATQNKDRFQKPHIGSDPLYGTDDEHGTDSRSYLELEKQPGVLVPEIALSSRDSQEANEKGHSGEESYTVDVVLSDMSAPWEQTEGFWKRSLSDPYYRMMNTSGINFRDHAGSMDLCEAALKFASDTLRPGGHFVCKFYQGSEDRALEDRLKALFSKVHREKPESSRRMSKESFFIALRRKGGVGNADMQS